MTPGKTCRWCGAPRLLFVYGTEERHRLKVVLVCSTCDAPLGAMLWARR